MYVEELPSEQVEVYAGTDLELSPADYESEEELIEAARTHFEENPDALRVWTSGGGATSVIPSPDETEPVEQADVDAILDAEENQRAVAGARGERGHEHVTAALNTLTGRFIQSVEYPVAPRTVRDEIEMRIAARNEISSV